MYKIQKLNSFLNNQSIRFVKNFTFTNYLNIKLDKYEIFTSKIIGNREFYLKINSGKLIFNLSKKDKQEEIFAEKKVLFKIENDNDIVLINQEYIINIHKNTRFLIQSYEKSEFSIFC
tara:strand:+ start:148 stop:501 length:354 start_codon:yes stop_codon:yes gene_type:complete